MISVCLTTYNGSSFLKEQLDSILKQLGQEDEVIISDDGSTDATLSIIAYYNDKRIKVLHHQPVPTKYKFSLTTNNFENALKYAKGDYIFLADQDDIWNKTKVRECLILFEKGYDLILHDCDIIDESNNRIADSYFEINKSRIGILNNFSKNSYLGCCMAINKKFLNKILPFPRIPVPHDIWIGLIYEKYGQVFFSKQKLISYRRHKNNVSPSGEKSNNSLVFRFTYRINILAAFLKRILTYRL
ncbi:glycosyltransferase family 2 protein [Chryseobacterium sp. TY4]